MRYKSPSSQLFALENKLSKPLQAKKQREQFLKRVTPQRRTVQSLSFDQDDAIELTYNPNHGVFESAPYASAKALAPEITEGAESYEVEAFEYDAIAMDYPMNAIAVEPSSEIPFEVEQNSVEDQGEPSARQQQEITKAMTAPVIEPEVLPPEVDDNERVGDAFSVEEEEAFEPDVEAFAADLDAILSEAHSQGSNSAIASEAISAPTVPEQEHHQNASSNIMEVGSDSLPDETPVAAPHRHDIFDRMAQGMSFANAYDLGTISLEQQFNKFDQTIDQEEKYWLAKEFGKKGKEEKKLTAKEIKENNKEEKENRAKKLLNDYWHHISIGGTDNDSKAATGFHWIGNESNANFKRIGTPTAADAHGVYEQWVKHNKTNVQKQSTFFPDAWKDQSWFEEAFKVLNDQNQITSAIKGDSSFIGMRLEVREPNWAKQIGGTIYPIYEGKDKPKLPQELSHSKAIDSEDKVRKQFQELFRDNFKHAGKGVQGADFIADHNRVLWIVEAKGAINWHSQGNYNFQTGAHSPAKQLRHSIQGHTNTLVEILKREQKPSNRIYSQNLLCAVTNIKEKDGLLALVIRESVDEEGTLSEFLDLYPTTLSEVINFIREIPDKLSDQEAKNERNKKLTSQIKALQTMHQNETWFVDYEALDAPKETLTLIHDQSFSTIDWYNEIDNPKYKDDLDVIEAIYNYERLQKPHRSLEVSTQYTDSLEKLMKQQSQSKIRILLQPVLSKIDNLKPQYFTNNEN